MSNQSSRNKVLAAIAGLAIVLAACSGAAGGAPSPTAAPPSPTATVVPSLNTPPPPTTPASAALTAMPDGTYVTAPIPVSDIDAKINADSKLSAAQRADALQAFSGHTREAFKLTLSNGAWTESDAWDGGSFEVGSRATFVSPDTHTVVIQESCCGLTTFEVTPSTPGFSLRIKSYVPSSAEDDLLAHIVFESAPFLPVP